MVSQTSFTKFIAKRKHKTISHNTSLCERKTKTNRQRKMSNSSFRSNFPHLDSDITVDIERQRPPSDSCFVIEDDTSVSTVRFGDDISYDDLIMSVDKITGMGMISGDFDDNNDGVIHDQLPSVEELKANLPRSRSAKKFKKMSTVLAVTSIAMLAVIVIFGVSASKSRKAEEFVPTGRGEDVIRLLFDMQASPLPALRDPNFPQHHAAMFVADGDVFQMSYNETPESTRRFVERYALAVMYYHFDGPNWNYDLNFLTARDHCEWSQSFDTVSGRTIRLGVTCDEKGFVSKLNLSQNNLQGHSIPDEVQSLENLETLHLYFNNIGGEFPEALRKMKNLRSIGLMQVGLQGIIPSWIGEMSQLTTLGLGNNNLHGDVPSSIARLNHLRILGLDDNNNLEGNLNLFKPMSSLEALYLENNAFTGQLPEGNQHWPNLVELDISNNMVDSKLPASLINHQSLAVLDVHKNLLTGTFPDDIFENNNLKVLAVHSNGITGTIPDRIGFLQKLQHLDISWNAMTGIIPDDISVLTDLRFLSTTKNSFESHPIPNLSQMTNLLDISMKGNNLVGTIPDWVGGLSNLERLDLDTNELTGTIPSWIGLLPDLKHLLLNRNKLVGSIPSQVQNLRHLDVFLIDGNSITGNADVICESKNVNPTYFVSDCYPGQNGEHAEIECRCCTTCCAEGDASCNSENHSWMESNVDPVWEYGFLRPNYQVNLENAPVEFSQENNSTVTDPIDDAFDWRNPN